MKTKKIIALVMTIIILTGCSQLDKVESVNNTTKDCVVNEGEKQLKCLDDGKLQDTNLGINLEIDLESGEYIYNDKETPELRGKLGVLQDKNGIELESEKIVSLLGIDNRYDLDINLTEIREMGFFIRYSDDNKIITITQERAKEIPIKFTNMERIVKLTDDPEDHYKVNRENGKTNIDIISDTRNTSEDDEYYIDSVSVNEKGEVIIRLVDHIVGYSLEESKLAKRVLSIDIPHKIGSKIIVKDDKGYKYKKIK